MRHCIVYRSVDVSEPGFSSPHPCPYLYKYLDASPLWGIQTDVGYRVLLPALEDPGALGGVGSPPPDPWKNSLPPNSTLLRVMSTAQLFSFSQIIAPPPGCQVPSPIKLDFQVGSVQRAAYIGRTALVPIHQCPSQQCVRDTANPDNLENFSLQGGGVTQTIGQSV